MYCICIIYLLNRLCDEDDIYRVYTVVGNKHEEDRHIPDGKYNGLYTFCSTWKANIMLVYSLFIYTYPLLWFQNNKNSFGLFTGEQISILFHSF